MNETNNPFDQIDLITGEQRFFAQGKIYTITALPISKFKEYLDEPHGLFIPKDDDPTIVMLNFIYVPQEDGTEINMKGLLEKWIPQLIEYNSKPASVDLLISHGWELPDFGRFLKIAFESSLPPTPEGSHEEVEANISFVDMVSTLESCGIAKETVLNTYTIPYLVTVYPKVVQAKTNALSPFNAMTALPSQTYGGDSTPTQSEVMDFFAGLI
ncbi:MAG: hypothetical protein SOY88_05730 [Massilioclostridium sp.]|nr:hypothetical protein [Massilioclostridium sp.]